MKTIDRTPSSRNAKRYFVKEKFKMDNTSLSHHGIKGMKWGVRRFQNKDGSRTAAGKRMEHGLFPAVSFLRSV